MSKLNKLIQCKLNEQDYLKLKSKLNSSGYNLSEFLRECILTNKTQVVDKSISKELIRQLSWIGNNVNQIARVLNYQKLNANLNDNVFIETRDNLKLINSMMRSLISLQIKNIDDDN